MRIMRLHILILFHFVHFIVEGDNVVNKSRLLAMLLSIELDDSLEKYSQKNLKAFVIAVLLLACRKTTVNAHYKK